MDEPISLTRVHQARVEAEKIRGIINQLNKNNACHPYFSSERYLFEKHLNALQLYLDDAMERLVDHFALNKIFKLILSGSCIGFLLGFWMFR